MKRDIFSVFDLISQNTQKDRVLATENKHFITELLSSPHTPPAFFEKELKNQLSFLSFFNFTV